MTTDERGFVLADNKDVMQVSELVRRALDALVWGELRLRFTADERQSPAARAQFQNTHLSLEPAANAVRAHCVFESRACTVVLLFACDNDHKDLADKSLALSVDGGPRSGLLRDATLHALSLLGPAWVRDGASKRRFGESAPTVLEAIRLGYLRPGELEAWEAAWSAGRVGQGLPFGAYWGASQADIESLRGLSDSESRLERVAQLLAGRAPTPRFLEELHMEQAQR